MLVTETYTLTSRTKGREPKYELVIYRMKWWQGTYERLWHWLFCDVIEKHLPKKITGYYVPSKWVGIRMKDGSDCKAPIYVWFDMHCSSNIGKYRNGNVVYQKTITKEEYEALSSKG